MEAPPLLDQDEGRPDGDRRRQDDQPRHESRGDVGDEKPRMAPPAAPAAHQMYRPWRPMNSRGRWSPLKSG